MIFTMRRYNYYEPALQPQPPKRHLVSEVKINRVLGILVVLPKYLMVFSTCSLPSPWKQ